jgi:hypothetical protein
LTGQSSITSESYYEAKGLLDARFRGHEKGVRRLPWFRVRP